MKKLFLLFLFLPFTALAQQDTTIVEQYCRLTVEPRALSNKVNIDVDFGEERKGLRGKLLKDEEGKIRKFNGVIDAFNYMGRQGWKLVNAYPLNGSSTTYYYIFKKEFKKSDSVD
jgi:hypothetical protein